MIQLTFAFLKNNIMKCLSILRASTIILSGDCQCEKITCEGCDEYEQLKSDQEEADTKVVLHAFDALSLSQNENVVIRSPSGDTDIFVIALSLIEEKSRVKFDYGNGDNRKEVWLDEIILPTDHCKALIGFHSFTGNDYISSFFRKGKAVCLEDHD